MVRVGWRGVGMGLIALLLAGSLGGPSASAAAAHAPDADTRQRFIDFAKALDAYETPCDDAFNTMKRQGAEDKALAHENAAAAVNVCTDMLKSVAQMKLPDFPGKKKAEIHQHLYDAQAGATGHIYNTGRVAYMMKAGLEVDRFDKDELLSVDEQSQIEHGKMLDALRRATLALGLPMEDLADALGLEAGSAQMLREFGKTHP